MSVTSGFFNSLKGDRKYDATSITKLFDGLINDGVYMAVGNALLVNTAGGMNVVVKPGRAWFNHTWTLNDADLLLTIDPSEVTLNRIDAVVLEVNTEEAVRGNTIKVVKGDPGETPTRPTLIRSEYINQYALAYILVPLKSKEVSQINITNAVGTKETPFVNSIIETIDTSEMYAQFTAEFNEWFNNIKGAVSDNAVLDLSSKMAGFTKIDNSIPTLIYRYILLPDSLSDSERNQIEGNPELMTIINDKQFVQIGDIVHIDARVNAGIPNGYLACDGGIINRSDYPEYTKKLNARSLILRRVRQGSDFTAYPWYHKFDEEWYTGTYKHTVKIIDHYTCDGYTVVAAPITDSIYWNNTRAYDLNNRYYGAMLVFNPEGRMIFADRISTGAGNSGIYCTEIPKYSSATGSSNYFNNCTLSMYFESSDTVHIVGKVYDGSNTRTTRVILKIDKEYDEVTKTVKQITHNTTGGSLWHIPKSNIAVGTYQTKASINADGGSSGTYGSYQHYVKIFNFEAATGTVTNGWFGSKDSDDLPYIPYNDADILPPYNMTGKYTDKGFYLLAGSGGYALIPYGTTDGTPSSRTSSGTTTDHVYPDYLKYEVAPGSAGLLDMCAKSGDWVPYELEDALYNMETGEKKNTSAYGSLIGSMIFNNEKYDLYVSGQTHMLRIVNSKDELIFDYDISSFDAEYTYKSKSSRYSAKNYIIIGHRIYLKYPDFYINSNGNSTGPGYIAYEDQYKTYLEVSMDEVQLPKLNITEGVVETNHIIRVK